MTDTKNDFSQGSVMGNILRLALPMTLAQFINVLYNIVDRVYIGMIPENSTLALTGLGLCLPIISMVIAFANLFGMGGAPLCSIERGRGNVKEAERIMGNSFVLLMISGVILTILGLIFKKPMLYLFGASDLTYPYADQYITVYLVGNIFVMIGLGMNSFINSQGFGTIGMMTVLLGAVSNIILDPIFIFVLNMGVRGAAFATIISQFLSAVWIVKFLTGKKAIIRLKTSCFRLEKYRVRNITGLGMSGFTMSITNSLVQILYNSSLQRYGGDLYVGIMTVVNSVREVITMPVNGVTSGAQPVMGYNYGAEKYDRVKRSIVFVSVVSIIYTTLMWGLIHSFPEFFIRIFNRDAELLKEGVAAMRIYYFGFFFMSLQFAAQSVFVALGKAKKAVFFSVFRKVVIVAPLILILPAIMGNGPAGILMSEPISNLIGGCACFITMLATVWPELGRKTSDKKLTYKETRGTDQ
ncbi:MATE family efflux transporter [Lacrimispora sp.]|uniref:MATE family efflux transporter n=1 Tax=Lacrimispora sp. TaxID=2719234 RepID=UPI002FD9F31B